MMAVSAVHSIKKLGLDKRLRKKVYKFPASVGKRFHNGTLARKCRNFSRGGKFAMTRLRVSNGLVLAALAGVLLASSPLFAQFHSAIEGTVTDSSGAAVPAAQVVLTNPDTGVSQTTVSNDTGAITSPASAWASTR